MARLSNETKIFGVNLLEPIQVFTPMKPPNTVAARHFACGRFADCVEALDEARDELESIARRGNAALCRVLMDAAPAPRALEALEAVAADGGRCVGKGGVVRDPALHEEVCARIEAWLAETMNWQVLGLTESPIRGPEGNIEFLIAARNDG